MSGKTVLYLIDMNYPPTIETSAFFKCESLTSITISESVTNIGDSAFSHCNSLASINIPESITSITRSMFSGCDALTSITIPENVKSIGISAFSNCLPKHRKNIRQPSISWHFYYPFAASPKLP